MVAVRTGDTLVVTKPNRLARSLPRQGHRRAHHGAGTFGLHAGSDMLVGVDGERRAPVTESRSDTALNGRLALRSGVPWVWRMSWSRITHWHQADGTEMSGRAPRWAGSISSWCFPE